MSLVLIVVGILLVGVGVGFAWINKATETAGGSGLKSISVEGPAWLVLIVVGLASIGFGTVRWESRDAVKVKDSVSTVAPTVPLDGGQEILPGDEMDEFMDEFPNGFTLGDNNELDRLWRACDRGVWEDCDNLYIQSDLGSDYEYFGATCGQPDFREPTELWCDPQRNIDEGLVDP